MTAGQNFVRSCFVLGEEFGYEFINKLNLSLSKATFSLGKLIISQEELQAEFESEASKLDLETEDGSFAWNLFRSVLEVAAQSILYQAFQLNAAISAADWDSEARQLKLCFQDEVRKWENNLFQALSSEEIQLWPRLEEKIKTSLGIIFAETTSLLAEEQRFWATLIFLLDRLGKDGDREEIYSLIRENSNHPGV